MVRAMVSLLRSFSTTGNFIQRLSYTAKYAATSGCKVHLARRLFIGQRSASVTTLPKLQEKKVTVTFIDRKGNPITTTAKENSTLLDVAKDNELNLDGFGICDGTVSCSTCHVILKEEDFKKVGEAKNDDENDMLDMAIGRTETSRLGCQITLTKDLDGIVVTLPAEVIDARES